MAKYVDMESCVTVQIDSKVDKNDNRCCEFIGDAENAKLDTKANDDNNRNK